MSTFRTRVLASLGCTAAALAVFAAPADAKPTSPTGNDLASAFRCGFLSATGSAGTDPACRGIDSRPDYWTQGSYPSYQSCTQAGKGYVRAGVARSYNCAITGPYGPYALGLFRK